MNEVVSISNFWAKEKITLNGTKFHVQSVKHIPCESQIFVADYNPVNK